MTELMPWKSRTRPNWSTKCPESTWIEVRGGELEKEGEEVEEEALEEVVEEVDEIKAKAMQDKRRPNISQLQPRLPLPGGLRIHNCHCHWRECRILLS